MDRTNLPDSKSSDICLVSLSPDEWLAFQKINSVEWKGPLTIAAYLRREEESVNQDLTRDGGLSPWALVWQTEPRRILCACDTIKKRAFVARNGSVDEVTCHAVCAVFCPDEFRGRGYASRMMQDLGERLSMYKDENAFSILYSDIGKTFYAARGWQPFPSAQIELKPAAATTLPAGVRLLTRDDLSDLCAVDERILHRRLVDARYNSSGRTCMAIVPDLRTVRWHHAREEVTTTELYGTIAGVKGAIFDEGPGHRVFAYWTMFFGDPNDPDDHNELIVLRMVVEDDADHDFGPATPEGVKSLQQRQSNATSALAAVLTVAQNEASRWDMHRVVIWNPTSAAWAAALQLDPEAAIEHRESKSIPSLRWYGSDAHESIDWVCNEKYGWC